jgi:CHAP domain
VKRFATLFVLLFCALIAMPSMGSAQTARQKVVNQLNYALSRSHNNGTSSQTVLFLGTYDYVGDWNWLDSDYGSYYTAYRLFGCDSSDWAISGDGSGCPAIEDYASFYSNPGYYGYSVVIPETTSYGRGGQCAYFADLVLARANIGFSGGLNFGTMWNNGTSIQQVRVGDIIVRYNNPQIQHVAIVVAVYGSGTTLNVDVIDSNFVNEGAANHEMIARHNLSYSVLVGNSSNPNFRVWKPSIPSPGY